MAKQTKKIGRRIANLAKKKAALEPRRRQPLSNGKDYFLLGMIAFTVLVLIYGWTSFDFSNRVMYILMLAALGITYARRHYPLSDQTDKYLERTGFVSIGMAVGLFCLQLYNTLR